MNSESLHYIERAPLVKTGKPAPLAILIHGYGSNEKDLFSFASELPRELHIISVQAPIELGFGAFAWYSINFDADQNKFSDLEEAKVSVEKIGAFVDEMIDKLTIDTNNVFLIGFSQGAILSYAVALNTKKVKNVVAMSGYLNEELIAKQPNTDVDFFISHGTVDQVIPVDWARNAPEILNKKGIKNTYKEYPVGHGVHPTNFYDFKKWIEERIR